MPHWQDYLTGFRAYSRWRRRRRRYVAADAEVPLRALLCLARLSPVWRLFGVLGMATAMSGFVISLTMVPAAATLCELAASPFFAALLGRVLLGERVSRITMLSMFVCAGGIIMFAFDEGGSPVFRSCQLYVHPLLIH
jgi:drug/metabolite transporter (DMT)-like permease